MKRRTFIQLSAYTALALTLPFAESCGSKNTPMDLPLLLSKIVDKKMLIETGSAYRKMRQDEDSQAALSEKLSRGMPTLDADALRRALNFQVKQEFIAGTTITVAGWVLSVTEARQCALFSILNS
ncbi:MAG TPA: hypothetical protein VHS53_08425 [Mucilaginibacter sp.]|jgi:hypothetical protein|nr:hypothetical protein [Mucilaginibacter sp.]